MVKESKNQEKLCMFFASDYHFEMISLPYINENLNKDKKVIVITENDLTNSITELVSKVVLSEEEKNRILMIDWRQNNLNKFRYLKDFYNYDKIVFIKGSINYINNINENINNWILDNKTQIINCFNIDEVKCDIKNIALKYDKVLFTSGIEKII